MSKALHKGLEAKLASLHGPEWDSSDEEDKQVETISAVAKKKGPKRKKERKRKVETISSSEEKSPVIYLGHIPEGFAEKEMFGFFSQFGSVRRIKLSRSKRTGNPRGYAFLEFADPDVAAIVAETMSGYFLMERRLVSHVVSKDKIHPELFVGMKNRSKVSFQSVKNWQEKNKNDVNKPKTIEGTKKITQKLLKREKAKRSKLLALGIDYSFPGYEASVSTDKKGSKKVDPAPKKKRKLSRDEDEKKILDTAPTSIEQKDDIALKAVTPKKTSKTPKKKAKTGSDTKKEGTKSTKKTRKNSETSLESTTEKKKSKTPKKGSKTENTKDKIVSEPSGKDGKSPIEDEKESTSLQKSEVDNSGNEHSVIESTPTRPTKKKGLAKTEVKAKKSKKKRRKSTQ